MSLITLDQLKTAVQKCRGELSEYMSEVTATLNSMSDEIDGIEAESGDISDLYLLFFGVQNQTTIFQSDGAILATNSLGTILTEFGTDSSGTAVITETLTMGSDVYVKKSVFEADKVTESYTKEE